MPKSETSSTVERLNQAYNAAKSSLVSFRALFLPLDGDVKPAWYHYKWSEILLNGDKNYAVEGFRQSAKSSLVLRAYPLYCLTFPSPDRQYIVFIMSTQRGASSRLHEIATEYKTNPLLSLNMVQVLQESQNVFEVEVKTGEKDSEGNDKTLIIHMEAYGKGSAVRGLNWHDLRPNIVIIDDPQDLEDSLSDTIQDKDWNWFLSDVYNLGKDSRIFLIGNNLGAKCIIERIADDPDKLDFTFMRIPILDDDNKSNWPEMFPIEDIYRERENFMALGNIDVWEREKMCIAVSPEMALFKPNYFRYFDLKSFNDNELSDCNIYITMDLAVSKRETADDTVILVTAINSDNQWFLIDCVAQRMDPNESMNELFTLVTKYKPVAVGIEKVAFQAAMKTFVENEMQRRKTYFQIIDLVAKEKKELRIQTALQPRFGHGTIWFPSGDYDWVKKLKEELLTFPKGRHDDIPDALAYVDQIGEPPLASWGDTDEEIGYAGAM